MVKSDFELRELVSAILAGDSNGVSRLIASSPSLARARFQAGATRQESKEYFLDQIGRYIMAGDSALHIAAAAYQAEIARSLLAAGADVHARNRRGAEPLHAAAAGLPGSPRWNPDAQTATIVCLIKAGADPNTVDKSGVSPLHIAVRTRCAKAVATLIEHGADATRQNGSGSTPKVLAMHNSGRGGSGSEDAKAEQREIVRLLERHAVDSKLGTIARLVPPAAS
jgi:hypothetical protein